MHEFVTLPSLFLQFGTSASSIQACYYISLLCQVLLGCLHSQPPSVFHKCNFELSHISLRETGEATCEQAQTVPTTQEGQAGHAKALPETHPQKSVLIKPTWEQHPGQEQRPVSAAN